VGKRGCRTRGGGEVVCRVGMTDGSREGRSMHGCAAESVSTGGGKEVNGEFNTRPGRGVLWGAGEEGR